MSSARALVHTAHPEPSKPEPRDTGLSSAGTAEDPISLLDSDLEPEEPEAATTRVQIGAVKSEERSIPSIDFPAYRRDPLQHTDHGAYQDPQAYVLETKCQLSQASPYYSHPPVSTSSGGVHDTLAAIVFDDPEEILGCDDKTPERKHEPPVPHEEDVIMAPAPPPPSEPAPEMLEDDLPRQTNVRPSILVRGALSSRNSRGDMPDYCGLRAASSDSEAESEADGDYPVRGPIDRGSSPERGLGGAPMDLDAYEEEEEFTAPRRGCSPRLPRRRRVPPAPVAVHNVVIPPCTHGTFVQLPGKAWSRGRRILCARPGLPAVAITMRGDLQFIDMHRR
jgi:hypothetical protein